MDKHMLRQAQQLQAKLAKAQEELSQLTVEVSSGGNAVKVVIDGQQRVQSVKIAPEAVDPEDVEGWAQAIAAVLQDDSLRDDLKRRGLERAARFSWGRAAEETIRVYEGMIHGERAL